MFVVQNKTSAQWPLLLVGWESWWVSIVYSPDYRLNNGLDRPGFPVYCPLCLGMLSERCDPEYDNDMLMLRLRDGDGRPYCRPSYLHDVLKDSYSLAEKLVHRGVDK